LLVAGQPGTNIFKKVNEEERKLHKQTMEEMRCALRESDN